MAADAPPAPNAPAPDAPEPAPDAAPPPAGAGKKRKLLVLAAVLVAAVLGAGLAYSQFGALDRTARGLLGSDAAEAAGEDAPIEYGEFTVIDGLVINPAGTDGARYLMVSVGLEAADPAVLEEVAGKDIVLRDAAIGLLSGKTIPVLADISQREGLKEELRALVNRTLREGEIDRLYFTQFMLQ